jgi:ppGpp synthetase/RelA/SpoT-type nucleotidyltranferase
MLPKSNRGITAIGERFRNYEEAANDRELIQEYRAFRCGDLQQLYDRMVEGLTDCSAILSCRIKRTDTIIRKLRREHAMDLVRMDDVLGFRIIVPSLTIQRQVVKQLQQKLIVSRVRDYTTTVVPSGYRAVHLAVSQELQLPGAETSSRYPCEIQVRTYYQHLWSTMSESFGEQVKEGGGSLDERAYLTELSELIRQSEEASPDRLQIEEIRSDLKTSFFVVHFDKKKGEMIKLEEFGTDLPAALQQSIYLEDLHRQDFERETVLLGVPTESELKFTHLRYFHTRGVPELPGEITLTRPRPEILPQV